MSFKTKQIIALILLFTGFVLVFFKLMVAENVSWWIIVSPFLGLPLIGVIDALIDVYKFYNKK